MNIRGILWDLDGTLVDSEPAHSAAFDAALRDFGLDVSLDFSHPAPWAALCLLCLKPPAYGRH
jgi:beta-phosphoglucomutase-like phosphatase (HAD superfamily)